jgi:hypothetical protein
VALSSVMLWLGCGEAPPLAATPLAGTINGRPWAGQGDVAFTSRAENGKWIDVTEGLASLGCSNFVAATELTGVLPWTTGAFDLSSARTLAFLLPAPDGGASTLTASIGRVELSDVTDAGARLRVRAQFDAESAVEGQVPLTVCE